MRFGIGVGENWEDDTKGLPKEVVVNVDLQLVPTYKKALEIPNQTVVSLRPEWVGGKYFGSEVDRINLLKEGILAGADFVEIEADMVEHFREELIELCENEMCGTIIVKYYPKVPTKTELQQDWNELHNLADFMKFNCRVDSYKDCKRFLDMCKYDNLIIAGQGEKGELLGILGGLCGMYLGYVPVKKVKKVMKLKLDGFGTSAFKKLEEDL